MTRAHRAGPGSPSGWPARLLLVAGLVGLAAPGRAATGGPATRGSAVGGSGGPAAATTATPGAPRDSSGSTSARVTLRVAADTSLEKVLTSLETSYETGHPDTDLVFTFGPTGVLRDKIMLRQLRADILVSAGEAEVGALMIGGHATAGTLVTVATNRLMLVTGLRGRLSALTQLRDPKIRKVAVGSPGTVPVGRDAVAALQRAGIWAEVKPRIRYCASSREIVAAVERHEVDAGLVYASDALGNPAVKIVMGLDSFSDPTRYVAVALKDDAGRTTGDSFITFLQSDSTRARFQQFRFGPP